MGGSRPACVNLTRLNPPEYITNYPNPSPSSHPFTSDISTFMSSTTQNTTFWASSPRPCTDRSDFALATSSGTILVAEESASWSFERQMGFRKHRSAAAGERGVEIVAVDWLDENVVISGGRDGAVRLWDVRIKSLAGTSAPLVHSSAINHVRKINGNRIVVAGIENRMAIYDLRFLQKSRLDSRVTNPFMTFPTYRNREWSGQSVGFDVLGDRLVAVGTDDERVQVFEAGSGKEVVVGEGEKLGGRKLGELARCLRFVNGGEGKREGVKLVVAAGRRMEKWSW